MTDWEKCVAFHGHACGGLTIGFKAAQYAASLLGLTRSADEQVVCVAENDACGVDAIQALLGCTAGKGESDFSACRESRRSRSMSAPPGAACASSCGGVPDGMTKEESFRYYQSRMPEELFDVKEAPQPVPERARIFRNVICDGCGETAGEPWTVLREGKRLCLSCADRAGREE